MDGGFADNIKCVPDNTSRSAELARYNLFRSAMGTAATHSARQVSECIIGLHSNYKFYMYNYLYLPALSLSEHA